MSKFACPERRLSCGKGMCERPAALGLQIPTQLGPREGDRVTSDLGPPYVSLERQLGVEGCWFRRSPAFGVRTGSQPDVQRKAIIGFPTPRPTRARPACLRLCPVKYFYRNRGGKRYSVIAKIRYTISTRTPTNHAERPLLVNRNAVSVEMSTITTAPGQNCRLIGAGAMT